MLLSERNAPEHAIALARTKGRLDRWLRLAAVVALVLLGAWLRLAHPQAIEFSDDQSWALTLATELLDGQGNPLRGPVSTSGSAHPPHLAYLLAIPLLVSRDPWLGWWLGTACIAALSLLVIPASFRVAELLFGTRPALLAALIAAVSPTGIAFGRKVWGPSFSFGIEALGLLALLLLLRSGNGRWLLLAAVTTTLGAMLHPSNAYFAPFALVVAMARLRSVGWRWVLGAAASVALIVAPLVVRELRDGATYFEGVFRATGGATTARVDADSLRLVAQVAAGDAYGWLSGTAFGPRLPGLGLDVPGTALLLAVLAGSLGTAWLAIRAMRRREWLRAGSLLLVLAWLWWPGLANLRHARELESHWFLGAIVAVGPVVAALAYLSRVTQVARFGVMALVVLIALGQAGEWQAHLRRALEVGPDTEFKMPLAYSLAAARMAADAAGGQPVLVANPNGMNSVFSYLARGRFLTRRFDDLHNWVIPADGSGTYVVDLTRSTMPMPSDASVIRSPAGREMYALVRGEALDSLEAPPDYRRQALAGILADVVEYESAVLPRAVQPAESFDILVRWRVTRSQAGLPVELHEFGHLVSDQGERVAGEDFRGFPVESWSPGDTVVSRFHIALPADLPPGRYWFDVGMYEPNTLVRMPIEIPGQAAGTTVRMGPIVVRSAQADPTPPAVTVGARLGDFAELVGYDIQRMNGRLRVRLVWRAIATTDDALTVFAQVLTPDGRVAGQHDGQPVNGTRPTTSWLPGELIEDSFELPDGATQGRIIVGMYRLPSVERLPVRDASGRAVGDSVDLGPVPQ